MIEGNFEKKQTRCKEKVQQSEGQRDACYTDVIHYLRKKTEYMNKYNERQNRSFLT